MKTGRPPLDKRSDTVRTGFATTARFWKLVLRQARLEGITHSELIRKALAEYLVRAVG